MGQEPLHNYKFPRLLLSMIIEHQQSKKPHNYKFLMSSCCCRFLHLRSLIVLLSSFALLAGRCISDVVECSPDQRSLLLRLKHGFSFPPNELVSWKPGSNCCTWEGVTCDSESGQIIGLDLGYPSITGYISHSLFNLTSLQTLNLYFDASNGHPIPQSGFEKLKDLTHLSVTNGHFVGQLPIGISHLTRLMYLNLDACYGTWAWSYHLKLQSLVGNLSNLRELHLRCANMSSDLDWGSALSKSAPQLQVLTVSNCHLPGLLPKDILTFKNLWYLDLSHNNRLLIQEVNDNYFHTFPKISIVKLAACGLTKVPAFLRYKNQITFLDLSQNKIGGAIPKWIWNIRPIGQGMLLNFSCNQLTHLEVPINLSTRGDESYNGWVLDFHSNRLQGPIPLSICTAKSLEFLDFSNNNLSGSIPQCLSTRFLLALDFSNNNFSGSIPRNFFEGNSGLYILNLRGNRLQGIIPLHINKGCNLEILVLSDHHLEGPLPRSLVNCSSLQVLDIGNNHIIDTFPFWLGSIVNLTVLNLRSNALYGPVKSMNSHEANEIFPKLQLLDLSTNHLDGDLPSKYFNNLKSMMSSSTRDRRVNSLLYMYDYEVLPFLSTEQTISLGRIFAISYTSVDFSNNHFEGDIPMVIGELQDLHKLNLSHNALTGRIPSALGNMTQLESLDLSANHLSGEIPQELTSLTFLSSLNLSTNDLSGKIPQDRQFSTFSNTSFDGNPGLCGIPLPLEKQCKKAAPRIADSMPPSKSDSSWLVYVVCLALFIGLGFGVGMAVVIVLQNVPLKFCKRGNDVSA